MEKKQFNNCLMCSFLFRLTGRIINLVQICMGPILPASSVNRYIPSTPKLATSGVGRAGCASFTLEHHNFAKVCRLPVEL